MRGPVSSGQPWLPCLHTWKRAPDTAGIVIPDSLKPADGRFGSGPSKVRPEQVEALSAAVAAYLGTSHRQKTVKSVVGRLRAGLRDLFSLPEGYEVVLGNGGTTCFWDAATFGLIERRSQHLSFGEFSSKFAAAAGAAPHLDEPSGHHLGARHPSRCRSPTPTSTSTRSPTTRPRPAWPWRSAVPAASTPAKPAAPIVAVDATSAAGGLRVDPTQADVYYYAPQKCFAADGGLWVANLSPAALERVERLAASGRWVPAFLDLKIAVDNSRAGPDLQHPGAGHDPPVHRAGRVDAGRRRPRVGGRAL